MQAENIKTRTVADADRIRAFMKSRGFDVCDCRANIEEFHALAQRLIPVEIASPDVIEAVQRRTRSSIYLRREAGNASGFLAFFAFSAVGEDAVHASTPFEGTRIRPEWVCEPSVDTRIGYVWGFGGLSRAACFGVIRTGRLLRDRFFPHLGVYARAATADGRKVMEPLGYRRASQYDPSFYFSAPFSLTQLRVAS
jgi:hypothetical protein